MQTPFSLQAHNSFGLDVYTDNFVEVNQANELPELLTQDPVLILGGGTNILFTKDVKGTVLKMNNQGKAIVEESEKEVVVEVQAGENWHNFVMWAIEKSYGGLENLALIPGSVGAAPIQNIGAYGVEQASCFESCRVWDRQTKSFDTLQHQACQFGYRNSIFKSTHKGRYIICSVRYRLRLHPHRFHLSYGGLADRFKDEQPTLQKIAIEVIDIRQRKLPDPRVLGNAGSFFKNPVIPENQLEYIRKDYPNIPSYPSDKGAYKIPAAWLIDTLGWKGHRNGDAGVHTQQALVLVNHGNATGKEIQQLSISIQQQVEDTFGIRLTPEVNIL